VAPARLVLLGAFPARALAGHDPSHNRGSTRFVNHDGGQVSAIASYHPRTLIGRPELKPAAWRDWQTIIGE